MQTKRNCRCRKTEEGGPHTAEVKTKHFMQVDNEFYFCCFFYIFHKTHNACVYKKFVVISSFRNDSMGTTTMIIEVLSKRLWLFISSFLSLLPWSNGRDNKNDCFHTVGHVVKLKVKLARLDYVIRAAQKASASDSVPHSPLRLC